MFPRFAAAAAVFALASPAMADPAADTARLFAQWDGSDGPGCAVSVTRDGRVEFTGAYGMAGVESRTPNTPRTAFQIGSISKQFTAFAVHMLAAEGALSLQDDVRKYVPEMHAFPQPITLDHLLHHTSGLRDEWMLLLQGRRAEDTITQRDVLRALYGQRELNFAPGSRFAYSNSNYTLLALVIERASGQAFPAFMKARIFEPLGMSRTWVKDDWRPIRPETARGYGQGPGGVESRIFPFSAYGAGNVYSTAEDMARWTLNLTDPKVGSPAIIADMTRTVRGPFAPSHYGSGIEVARWRGLDVLRHGGIAPGAASYMMAVPDRGFGVTVLCNAETNDTGRIAERIADIHLADGPPPAEPKVELSEARLRRFVGRYREPGGPVFVLDVRDGRLTIGGNALEPIAPTAFRLVGAPVHFSFTGPDDAPAAALNIHDPDQDRIALRHEAPDAPELTPDGMQDYPGHYYSPELGAVLQVERREDQLWVTGAAFEDRLRQPPPGERAPDAYFTDSTIGAIEFSRDGQGRVTGLTQSNGRVIGIRFLKVDLPRL